MSPLLVENEVKGFSGSSQVTNFGDLKRDVVVSIGSTEVGTGGPHGSRDDVNLFSRDSDDDDEKFSPYMTRPVARIGDRRIRKMLASRHWNNAGTLQN
ncbi:hypothetical protein Bca101_020521 [Brassica carinata]